MSAPPPGIASNAVIVHMLRTLWSTWLVMDGSPTCDLRRYTETGGNGYSVAPTPSLVALLTGLSVAVSQPGEYLATPSDRLKGPPLKSGEREFCFLDLPAAGGVPANTLTAMDRVYFEGIEWEVVSDGAGGARIQNDTAIGTSIGVFRRV